MASIKKIDGKTGTGFKITVTRGRDSHGKQIRYFKTWTPDRPMTARQMEREVKRVALDFEREIELGYQADNRQTFDQYAKYVIELQERNGVSRSSIEHYEYFLRRISPAIGHMKLREIRPQHLNAFYWQLGQPGVRDRDNMMMAPKVNFQKLAEEKGLSQNAFSKECGISRRMVQRIFNGDYVGIEYARRVAHFWGKNLSEMFKSDRKSEPLSPETIRLHHAFISRVLSQAEKEMLIPYNPAKKANSPSPEKREPNYFQPEQVEQILDALETEDIKHRTMIHLFIVTGCRLGEIVGLKWGKIDFENRQIKIDSSLNYSHKIGTYEGPTKTRNTRYVSIPDETATLLRRYRAWQAERRLNMGDMWQDCGYVFTRDTGEPISRAAVESWLKRFSARHNLPHINPHAFRHSFASIMIANGVDIVTVSKMLGHAKTSMTTDTYSHIIEDAKRNATECVADVILRRKKA
jgi:integrase